MVGLREFGLPGVSLEPGDHVCALVLGKKQRDAVLLPCLLEGLRNGDKCMIAIDEVDSAGLLGMVTAEAGVTSLNPDEIEVQTRRDSALNRGRFSLDDALRSWQQVVANARLHNPFIRLGGDARWWLHQEPDAEDFIHYELELNRFVTVASDTSMLCIYDLSHFGGDVLTHIVVTHPKLMLADMPFDNPYYLSPEEYREARRKRLPPLQLPGPAAPYER